MFEVDPIILHLVFLSWAAVSVMLMLFYLKQPTPVAYIVTGLLIGPHVLGIVNDQHILERLGELGLILLLFFVGTEVSVERFASNWRLVLGGTVLQVCLSVGLMLAVGHVLEWPVELSILLGFIISLSSTAVVLKYFEERSLLSTKLGFEVTGILIMQDLLVVPMLLVVSWMGGEREVAAWPYQLVGLLALGLVTYGVIQWRHTTVPSWIEPFRNEREIQLFASLLLCFGLALLSGFAGLSTGLGAFVGGIVVAHIGGVKWVRKQLHSFHTFFMALFFMSIGMLINLSFLADNAILIGLLVVFVLTANTCINALIFRAQGESWRYSVFAGATLAQVGELSFLLAATGLTVGAFATKGYQIAVLVIALTLVIAPLWIEFIGRARTVVAESRALKRFSQKG